MTHDSCLMTQKRKMIFVLIIFLALILGELSFAKFIATQDQKNIIAIYNIDKIFHVIGGVFFVLLGRLVFPRASWKTIFMLAIIGVVAWEIYEVLFDADVNWFFYHRRTIWRNDTIGDLIGDVVGMLCALFVLFRKGGSPPEELFSSIQ